jgi:hypothetical protein
LTCVVAGLVLAMVSCTTSTADLSSCDGVVTRCDTVCDTWCDDYGCYPDCYDTCWDECYVDPNKHAPTVPVADAAAPPAAGDAAPPPPANDAGSPLCGACQSTDQCGAGGLCIVRSGDAGTGFCSQPCSGTPKVSNCPAGFTCSSLGSGQQCLPSAGRCP